MPNNLKLVFTWNEWRLKFGFFCFYNFFEWQSKAKTSTFLGQFHKHKGSKTPFFLNDSILGNDVDKLATHILTLFPFSIVLKIVEVVINLLCLLGRFGRYKFVILEIPIYLFLYVVVFVSLIFSGIVGKRQPFKILIILKIWIFFCTFSALPSI